MGEKEILKEHLDSIQNKKYEWFFEETKSTISIWFRFSRYVLNMHFNFCDQFVYLIRYMSQLFVLLVVHKISIWKYSISSFKKVYSRTVQLINNNTCSLHHKQLYLNNVILMFFENHLFGPVRDYRKRLLRQWGWGRDVYSLLVFFLYL